MSISHQPRKRVYVNQAIQGQIVRRLAAYWCVYHLVLFHSMFLMRLVQYGGNVAAGGVPVPFGRLYLAFLLQQSPLIMCALVIFPLIVWDMVRVTHRVAGPLLRFEATLRRLSRGERVENIELREDDLLGEFQQAFNEYLETLNASIETPPTGADTRTGTGTDAEADSTPEETIRRELSEIQRTVSSASRATESGRTSDETASGRIADQTQPIDPLAVNQTTFDSGL